MSDDSNREVQQFDAKALQDRVLETVRSSYGMMIPDDLWQGMVEKEITAFFEEERAFVLSKQKIEDHTWNGHTVRQLEDQMTPFRQQVWSEVNKLTHKKLQEYFASDKFTAMVGFDENQEVLLSAFMEKKLAENTVKMASSMFASMFANVASQVKMDISNEIMNGNIRGPMG